MRSLVHSLLAIAVLLPLAASCALLEEEGEPRLQKGLRVEVSGRLDRAGVADDLEQKGDDARLEARGSLSVAEDGQRELLGVRLILDEKTEFEDADKNEIERPELPEGTWVMIRGTADGDAVRVRKMRLEKRRGKWEVEGRVTAVDGPIPGEPGTRFSIDGFEFRTRRGTDVLLDDPEREWRQFLDQGPLARRAGKEEKFLPYSVELGERTRLGGQVAFESEREDNFDLDSRRNRNQYKTDGRSKLSLIHRLGEEGFVLAEVQLLAQSDVKRGRPNERDLDLEPSEVYAFIPDVGIEGLHLQVGRQSLDEQREWLYDQNLDAARVYYELETVQFEASVSRTPRRLATTRAEPVVNFIGAAHWRPVRDWLLSAYVIDRRTREIDDFSPFHYGLRSYTEPDPGFHHWLELSRVDGIVDGRRLRAGAVDIGGGWVADLEWQPAVTVGYAMAEGGRTTDRLDRNYRQTGLQDNNGKWNGVTSFRYYGELFDPELSNLHVQSLGVGVRPDRRSSIDLVFHRYLQDRAFAGSARSELRAPTNGRKRQLGRELDLILGIRRPRWTAEVVGGVFTPGPAFDRGDVAVFASFQLRLKF